MHLFILRLIILSRVTNLQTILLQSSYNFVNKIKLISLNLSLLEQTFAHFKGNSGCLQRLESLQMDICNQRVTF